MKLFVSRYSYRHERRRRLVRKWVGAGSAFVVESYKNGWLVDISDDQMRVLKWVLSK